MCCRRRRRPRSATPSMPGVPSELAFAAGGHLVRVAHHAGLAPPRRPRSAPAFSAPLLDRRALRPRGRHAVAAVAHSLLERAVECPVRPALLATAQRRRRGLNREISGRRPQLLAERQLAVDL